MSADTVRREMSADTVRRETSADTVRREMWADTVRQIYFSKSCIIVCNFKAFLRGLWEQVQFYVNHKHQHTENLKKHRKKQRTFRHTEKT